MKKAMLYAPKYYSNFACIADKCTHSCCVGWDVYIDRLTMEKYRALQSAYADKIRESICGDDEPRFRMCADGRCPHLDERGLCKIIIDSGEEYLCDICREHPRFYNDTLNGREVGLGMSCEEACRIILSSDSYADITVIGSARGRTRTPRFDTLSHRKWIYSVISDRSVPYGERLKAIAERYGVSLDAKTDGEWRAFLLSLEYLDEAHRELFSCFSSESFTPCELEKTLERALAYFIYRHCAEVESYEELCASVGFALFCERLLASVLKNGEFPIAGSIVSAAVALSEEIEYSEENTEAIKNEFWF